ncbi:uncharacterized protein [Panulirus ornatus]|uniref:uncharacterized protein n=1 Tax=Panulirus ornatus TaxID=150431 RepID=UPI003A89BBF4
MKIFVALVVVAAVVAKLGSGRDSQSSFPVSEAEEEPQRRLCGWRLANKLNKVCKGIYNKPGSTRNLYYYYRDRRAGGGSEPVPPPDESLAAPAAAKVLRYRPLSPRDLLQPYTSDVIDSWDDEVRSSGAIFKPRVPQELLRQSTQYQDGGSESGQLPFLTEMEASQVVRTRQPSKRGLSAECCRKVCTVSELVGYCY